MMTIEKFKGTVRVPRSSPGEGAEDEYDERKGLPLVRFDSYRNPFVMLERSCTNPGCNCNEVSLSFTEIENSGKPIPDPTWFSFCLDLNTWKEKRIPERSKISQGFVDEFINNLTDEMKTRFKKDYASSKQRVRNAARFKMPIDEIEKGTLVSYMNVFGNTGSILTGGKEAGFGFENKGKEHFIDDLYCINPRCKCETVQLVFLTYDEEKNALIDLFLGIFSFKKGFTVDEEDIFCTKKEALKIFADWKKSEPENIGLLKHRYEEMKAIGQRILSEDDNPGKVKMKIPGKKRTKKKKKGKK